LTEPHAHSWYTDEHLTGYICLDCNEERPDLGQSALCQSEHCRPNNPRQAQRGSALCEKCEDRAWDDLQVVARVWPDTEVQLMGAVKGGDGSGVRAVKDPGLSLNPRVVEARQDITNTLLFWAHLLLDERRTLTAPKGEADALARFVGANLAHLTHHHDQGIAVSIAEDARRLAKLARRTAYPSGARLFKPGVPCTEHTTNDLGERIPCPGEYQAWVIEGNGLPELACTEDQTHTLSPTGFKINPSQINHAAGANLVRVITGMNVA
jgi:hypothetical protein